MPENAADLLDQVHDQASFIKFVFALAAERELAEVMEQKEPLKYSLGGAMGWQNGSISTFLDCAAAGFEANRRNESAAQPSWHDIALFLWLGKIYE